MIVRKKPVIRRACVALACAVLAACGSDTGGPVVDGSTPDSGSADFSRYVSLGDSLTAGFADGTLYLAAQKNSFPQILASQLAEAGGGSFTQPLVSDNIGGLLINGATNPAFPKRTALNTDTQTPELVDGTPTTEVVGSGLNGQVFNNLGVPGAKSFHLLASGFGDPAGIAAGTANPFFVRFATTPSTTVMADAVAQSPTFVTLWIGNNDVLLFAAFGGIGIDQKGNTDPSTYGANDITDPAVFDSTYKALIATLKAANADIKGVLLNIPDIVTLPYFTTVPFNAVPLDQATADQLNAGYKAYNDGLAAAQAAGLITADEQAKRTISFAEGKNAVVMLDEDLTDLTVLDPALVNMRQATSADLVILPTGSKIGTLADPNDPNSAFGIGAPLVDGDVLSEAEVAAVVAARDAYNASIKAVADAESNFAFVDVASVMNELNTSGLDYGNGSVTATYASGGAFSLDGLHPSGRGYAIVANEVRDAINSTFGANVHAVDPGAFPTIFFK